MVWFESLLSIPHSASLILCVCFIISLVSMIVYWLMTDVDKLTTTEVEVKRHNQQLREAEKRNDKAMIRRLKRKDLRMKQLARKSTSQRSKVSLITMIPFTIIYLYLSSTFKGIDVAVFPFELPLIGRYVGDHFVIPFSIWYIICYFTSYLVLSRIFRIRPDDDLPQPKEPRERIGKRRRRKRR